MCRVVCRTRIRHIDHCRVGGIGEAASATECGRGTTVADEQGSWKSATFSRADEGSIEGPTSKGEREWGAHETPTERGAEQDSDATATLHRLRVPQGAGSRESSLCPRWTGLWGGGMGRFLFPSHAPRYDVKLACQLPSPPLFPHAHTHTHALAPHPVAACPHETPRHTTPLDQCGGPPKGEGPSVAQG